MLVPISLIEVVGLRPRLDDALAALQQLGVAEVVTVVEGGEPPVELADLIARIDAVCSHAPEIAAGAATPDATPDAKLDETLDKVLDDAALRTELERLEPQVAAMLTMAQELRSEAETLPRYIEALDGLQPLVPELGRLDDQQLANLGLASMAMVIDDPDGRVVPELTVRLGVMLGRGHLLVTSPAASGSAVGCLLVLRRASVAGVNALLGTERVVEVGVPDRYAGLSLRATVDAMRVRGAALPQERERLQRQLATMVGSVAGTLQATAATLRARLERAQAARHAEMSSRTFLLQLWVPDDQIGTIEQRLTERLGSAVAVEHVADEHVADQGRAGPAAIEDRPVLLRNRPAWLPFQRLVGFLSWPERDGLDPTGLMALALPMFFGAMVGDVVYGAGLVAIAWWVRRRWSANLTVGELGRVLILGGRWAVVFGFLYGEALGSLGHTLGMPALWFYRGGPSALEPLLVFAVAIGLAHVVLGLLLGLWTAARGHRRRQLGSKAGTLLVLAGLFGLAGITADGLPTALLTPAVAAVVVGTVVACVSQGALGLILGPLGLLGTLGNVLSYLRLAAVGLASTYLAEVANALGAEGPLLLGVLVATLFHSLNLALAAFSPMIQSLRLQYVEFFGQFHEGGGRLLAPLGGAMAGARETDREAATQLPTRTPPEPVPAGTNA